MNTKIFKQFICTLLVMSVIFSLSSTAFAIDDVDITPEYEDEVIDESTYIVDESELVHTPYNPPSEDEIPVENPDCQIIHDDPDDPIVTTYVSLYPHQPLSIFVQLFLPSPFTFPPFSAILNKEGSPAGRQPLPH